MINVPMVPTVRGGVTMEGRVAVPKRGILRTGGATGTRIVGNNAFTTSVTVSLFLERIGGPGSLVRASLLITPS